MNAAVKVLLLLLLGMFSLMVEGQEAKLLELEKQLSTYKREDTIKVNMLTEIANLINFNDADRTLNYAQQAYSLSAKLNFTKGKAESLWLIGLSYNKIDKSLSLEYFEKSLKVSEAIKDRQMIARCLNGIGMIHRKRAQREKATIYLEKAVKLAEEINDQLGLANYLIDLSGFYHVQGLREQAVDGLQRSLRILKKVNDKPSLAKCYNNLAVVYGEVGNFPLALDFNLKSLQIKEELDDKSGILSSLINVSYIYRLQGRYEQALSDLKKALALAEKLKDKQKYSVCLEKIGMVYQMQNKPEALDYYLKALKIGEELKDNYIIGNEYECIGSYYYQLKEYTKALQYFQIALKKSIEVNRKQSESDVLTKMVNTYIKLKQLDKAKSYALQSLGIAKELKMINDMQTIYYQLSQIDSATGNFQAAFINYQQYKAYSDSIFNEKNVQRITELRLNFKFDKEKNLIELENKKQIAIHKAEQKIQAIIIVSLIVGFLIISIFAVYIYRSYRFKNQTNILLTQQKESISVLNEEYIALNEELKQSNEQLIHTKLLIEESEEKLKLLIKNSNDIFVMVNEKGEQFFISDVAKTLTGYSVKELLGNIKDVIYPDDVPIVKKHLEQVMNDNTIPHTIQYRHKHKRKGYIWFEAVAQNFLAHPAINAIVANVRDITERKNIEEAMKENEEAKAALMQMEIERINSELESKQKSMTAATLKLIQNSERDTKAIAQLQEIEKDVNAEGRLKINALIADYKRVSYNSNWEEFEILFEKVHRTFYENLNTQFPNLTANERKLCAFLKLNMSSKDIAQITFQSDDALKKARLRLRQKLGIDREMNLTVFLQNV
jgi:PAS domain S-box-containing protein